MICSRNALLALFALLLALPAVAQEGVAQFRQLSRAARDHLPSSDEARAFYAAGDKTAALEESLAAWLASPAHEGRVRRYFHDMFGIEPWVFVAEGSLDLIPYAAGGAEAPSDLATAGVWHLPASVKPTCGAPVTRTAWWSETPIQICSTAVSTAIVFPGNPFVYCPDPFGANGIRHAACGCGPEQVLCIPRPFKGKIVAGVVQEFAERAVHAYANGKTWTELLGGDLFYGDRWLYHHYLYQERILPRGEAPNAAEMALLRALPTDGTKAEMSFPVGSVERAGVATAPAFLRRFNNFRSRIRALSERLLCKDVDGSLNTSGITTFVNPDLSAFDREHGTKEDCASCHFGMDNLGSTLLGWGPEGFYQTYPTTFSQLGHVFGVDGTGPRLLMNGFLEQPGFNECMAKTAWEDFSGIAWTALAEDERLALTSAAASGPRGAIRGVLESVGLRDARKHVEALVTVAAPAITFAQVAPLVERSCNGAECHGTTYVGNEAALKAAPATRVESGSMPPAGSGRTLSAEERGLIVRFMTP